MTVRLLVEPPLEAEAFPNPAVERPKGCLGSRVWYLIPAAVCGCSAVARFAGGSLGDCAAVGAISGVGIGILSALGRGIFAAVTEGREAALREWEAAVSFQMEPEGVCSNSLLALTPWVFCGGVGVKFLMDRQEKEDSAV